MEYNSFLKILDELISNNAYKIILSGPDAGAEFVKVTVRADGEIYRAEQLTEKQAFHKNLGRAELSEYFAGVSPFFKRLNAWTDGLEYAAKKAKKGKIFVTKLAAKNAPEKTLGHDNEKQYVLSENKIVLPLVDMGVMTAQGKIVKVMYSKYRQINRYLEIIDDIVSGYDLKKLSVADFGCGKSYLTFVVYHYLTEIKKLDVEMTGVDLKEDVIDFCAGVARKYDCRGLNFVKGDISKYEGAFDMVISLHACDTATDYVLFNALKNKSRFILSSPCCQHEIAKQISFENLPILGEHGVLRERVSSLVTDALRCEVLTACGYKTQLMEFVDLGHTPKNLLIRAVRDEASADKRKKALERINGCLESFSIYPTLCRLVEESGMLSFSDKVRRR